jgi:hypothetical protein
MFGSPDYLWSQRESLLDECDASRPTARTKATKQEMVSSINDNLLTWLRDMPYEDRIATMRDAQLSLQHLLFAKLSVEEIRQVVVVAKSVGRLAESIENYFKAGGTIYDRKVGQVPPFRDGIDGSDEATR